MTVEERVSRGAALLDRKVPGWENRIDLDRLDISSTANCILGQLYSPTTSWVGEGYTNLYAVGMGTDISILDEYVDFPELKAEWKRVITERRMMVR